MTSSARIRVNGAADEQRIETQARVSWTLDRRASGAVRASGFVDGFAIVSSLDSIRTGSGTLTPRILLDGFLDSTALRVVTRPPQVNECDRVETGASAIARDLLVRIPDGMAVGDQWKDSTVSLGLPLWCADNGVHCGPIPTRAPDGRPPDRASGRHVKARGKGGSPFRGLELTGTGSGEQRVQISAQRGILERLEGTSTLTLQVTERLSSVPARTQQVVQRVELTAERVR